MSTIISASEPFIPAKKPSKFVDSTFGFEWAVIVACGWLVAGIYLDGWAHNHIPSLETFFTPWHAVLYSGYAAVAVVLVFNLVRNHVRGYDWRYALPSGYPLSLAGAVVFGTGGLLDLTWHTLFGIEQSFEALLSPSHLVLASGVALIVSGPLRSAWQRQSASPLGWLPLLLSVTYLLSLITFFTQTTHPFVAPQATFAPDKTRPQPAALPVSELYAMRADGTGQTRLTMNQQMDKFQPAWSPDSQRLAFAAGKENKTDIYTMRKDGTSLTRLTATAANNQQPAWSPDGGKLAFVATENGRNEIFVMGADGSAPTQLTHNLPYDSEAPVWSPDGTSLVFVVNPGPNSQLYRMSATGGQPTSLLTQPFISSTSWSPDGSTLLFSVGHSDEGVLSLMHPDGSGFTRLSSYPINGLWPVWSGDGRKIAFLSLTQGAWQVFVVNSDGSNLALLSDNTALPAWGPLAWSPDGSTIIFSSRGNLSSFGGGSASNDQLQALGVQGILLQTALLMGLILLLLRRWTLPFGSLTLIFTLNVVLLSFLRYQFWLIPAALVAGLLADVLLKVFKPEPTHIKKFRLFALSVPCGLYSLYFLNLTLNQGMGWSIPLWTGSIVLAGVVGLFVSCLVLPPKAPRLNEHFRPTP